MSGTFFAAMTAKFTIAETAAWEDITNILYSRSNVA